MRVKYASVQKQWTPSKLKLTVRIPSTQAPAPTKVMQPARQMHQANCISLFPRGFRPGRNAPRERDR
jgi:hypothetical protein